MADPTHATEIERLKEKVKNATEARQNPIAYLSTLAALRKLLVASITKDDLKWFTLPLKMGDRGTALARYTVEVCAPVVVYGYFVPVTARETWTLADRFGAFPLTRAVADQQVNVAVDKGMFVTAVGNTQDINTHGPGFDTFTEKLRKTNYGQVVPSAAGIGVGGVVAAGAAIYTQVVPGVAGAHKLWLLSNTASDKRPVNYGFHHAGKRDPQAQGDKGPYLYPEYSVINGLIPAHDWDGHWDYSQLLQLMKDPFQDVGSGLNRSRPKREQHATGMPALHNAGGFTRLSLREALLQKHPAVWDEKTPLNPARLPKSPEWSRSLTSVTLDVWS
jgi:hypothetical protein